MEEKKISKDMFRSPSSGRIRLASVAEEISKYINEDSQSKYRLIVGTDSNGNGKTNFVTAIIVCRVGRGGRYFWKKTNGDKIYHTLRDRIYKEVTLSLQYAQNILGELESFIEKTDEPNYDFQIHIDVGQNGPTRDMIKEVVGMVRGNGFKAKIKPDSYAASSVADKYT